MSGDSSRVKVIGPLVPFVSGFRAELQRQGYRPGPVCDQLRLMAHVSRWLASRGLDVVDLGPGRVEEFLAARRAEGYTLWRSEKGLAPLLAYLGGLGVLPAPESTASSPVSDLVERYHAYLVKERGLASGTVVGYLHVAGLFLATRAQAPDLALDVLTPSEVIEFVLAECRQRSRGSARYIVCGLRALLRFCHLEGLTTRPLTEAVPAVANWRGASLPKALSIDEVAALLTSCDRRTTFGRRDFAVLTLLARLGLRAGEVAGLCLEDIDWRRGELIVRGKGSRKERLPLPGDVGEAIAEWLRRGRPGCAGREVFVRVRAPHQRLSSGGVSAIVRAACARAGVVEVNAHRLRHTAATEMLRAGAGLDEIGQVLRHRSVLSTAIYAKVDRVSLRALAKPWPVEAGVSR
jgi:integrase/recombinase XerD